MAETRKLAAILVSDVAGYSRLAGADEDRTLARLRTLRSDLIDPIISVHHGRVVKRTGDGSIIEFRSMVDAVRCAIEVQSAMVERNADVAQEKRIEFRVGIHLGDVVEESDGDLMGDGVNIAARLQAVAKPGGIALSEDAYRQVKGRLNVAVSDLGPTQLKNIAEPVRVYALEVGTFAPPPVEPARRVTPPQRRAPRAVLAIALAALVAIAVGSAWYSLSPVRRQPTDPNSAAPHLSLVVLPFTNLSGDASQDYLGDVLTEELTTSLSRLPDSFVVSRTTAFAYRGKAEDVKDIGKELGVHYVLEGSAQKSGARQGQRPTYRRFDRRSPLGESVRRQSRRNVGHAGRNRHPPRAGASSSTRRRRSEPRRARVARSVAQVKRRQPFESPLLRDTRPCRCG
jgi:adenylate cyclase